MSWTRLPDVNGFARWRSPSTNGLASHILANRSGIIVAVSGRIFMAATEDELEDGLARLFERLDWRVYHAAQQAIGEAWRVVTRRAGLVGRYQLSRLAIAEARG